ncbi:hypothetical protein X941_5739 [Burkholderia pseudomallei MSHR5569]|nr:hypothetical protein X941_5739 [Burkholderia pseudomallei MSHR5569]
MGRVALRSELGSGRLLLVFQKDRLTHRERCGRATDSGGNAHAG